MHEATDARQLSRAQQNYVTLQARLRAETKKRGGYEACIALNTARVNTRHRQSHRDHISCGIATSRNNQYKTFIFDNGLVWALPSSSPFHPHHASNPPSTSQRLMTGVYYVYWRVGAKAGATPLE